MQVKRFFAENMRLALKQVREEIGPDAVILSSKRSENGVEILTAIDGDDHPLAATTGAANDQGQRDNPFRDALQRSGVAKPSRLEAELDRMQQQSRQRARALAETLNRKHSARADAEYRDTAAAVADEPVAAATPAADVVTLSAAPAPAAASVVASAGPAASAVSGANRPAGDDNTRAAADFVAPAAASVEGEVALLRSELQSMRDMLEQQLSSMAWGSYRQQYPRQASLWRRMKRMGLSATVAHGLLESVGADPRGNEQQQWQKLMQTLAGRLPVDSSDPVANGGVFVLVGPTGAGKTTTIGKLATRYVLQHGAEGVALVTTDSARIAGFEHLRTFGRILNVPVKIVDKHTSLERVLYGLRHKSLVLVDTAGFSRQDPRLQQQISMLCDMAGRVNTLLTLPATSQKPVIKSAWHSYKAASLAGCILTKLDEASSIGEVLSLAIEKRLPVWYGANGQGIPDHIRVADSRWLIRHAIDLARRVVSEDSAMVEEVASLAGRG